MVPHVVTRLYLSPWGCAISLIQFAPCSTPIYCKGTMFRRGTPTLLRSLVQIVTPSLWNVIIWWNLISLCKACQCEERRKCMNMLQEIWRPRLIHSTSFKGALQIAMFWSMPLLYHEYKSIGISQNILKVSYFVFSNYKMEIQKKKMKK